MSIILDGTNGISDVDGSASTPAIRGTDANTGIFFPAADTIAFAEGGAEVARFDSSGNLGIGTTSPTSGSVLDVASGSTTYPRVRSTVGSAAALFFQNSETGTTTSDGMYIGITGAEEGVIWNNENTDLRIATNNAERVRIDTSGNLLVGTTVTTNTVVGSRLFPGGGAHFTETTTGDGPLTQFININASIANGYRFCSFRINSGGTEKGTITYNTGTGQVNYNQTSDRRLKTNIQPSESALDVLSQMQIVSFDMIEGGHTNFGVIAQDLEEVFPEAVSPGDDGEIVEKAWGVDTSNLVPALVKAIQELKAELDAAKARIATLEAK